MQLYDGIHLEVREFGDKLSLDAEVGSATGIAEPRKRPLGMCCLITYCMDIVWLLSLLPSQEELQRWEETSEDFIEDFVDDKENPVAERAVEALVALGGTNVHQYRGPHRVSALYVPAKPFAFTKVCCALLCHIIGWHHLRCR